MSRLAPIALIAILAGCANAQPYQMSERDAAQLKEALGDKVAGEPKDCLAISSTRNPNVIDEKHILFRQGKTTWLNTLNQRCPLIDGSGYALVLEPFGSTNVCSGDIARVMDTATGQIIGGCSLGEFVPYRSAMK